MREEEEEGKGLEFGMDGMEWKGKERGVKNELRDNELLSRVSVSPSG